MCKSRVAYSYSCLLARLPEPVATQVKRFGLSIPENRIKYDKDGEMGREDDPHITVKYGIHSTDVDEVMEKMRGCQPVRAVLGDTCVFYNENAVVLKIAIRSRDLMELNRHVCDSFKCTDKFTEYRPHCTIAYLKKNNMDPYWFREFYTDQFDGIGVQIGELVFSTPKGSKWMIPLGGDSAVDIKAARELVKVARLVAR